MYRPIKLLVMCLVAAGVMTLVDSDAHARRGRGLILITFGDDIKDVGEIKQRPPARPGNASYGPNERVGYFCQAVGVLWIFDVWSWGGQWCTYDGDTYYEITEAQAAFLLGIQESELSKPFLYSFPLGLICILGFVGFVVVINIFSKDEAETSGFEMVANADQAVMPGAQPMGMELNPQLDNANSFGNPTAPQQFAQPMTLESQQSFAQPMANDTSVASSNDIRQASQASGAATNGGVSGIYIMKRGKRFGPMSMEQLSGLIQKGQVSAVDQYWVEGMPEWQTVGTLMGE